MARLENKSIGFSFFFFFGLQILDSHTAVHVCRLCVTFASLALLIKSLSFLSAAFLGRDWMSLNKSCSSASNSFLLSGINSGWDQKEPM